MRLTDADLEGLEYTDIDERNAALAELQAARGEVAALRESLIHACELRQVSHENERQLWAMRTTANRLSDPYSHSRVQDTYNKWESHDAVCTDRDTLRAEVDRLTKQKNDAYGERDRCVVGLAALAMHLGWSAWLGRHEPDPKWDQDWMTIVFVALPTGQVSWHIHDSEVEWFSFLPDASRSPDHAWDGHTTPEKYDRIAKLSALTECDTLAAEVERLRGHSLLRAHAELHDQLRAVVDCAIDEAKMRPSTMLGADAPVRAMRSLLTERDDLRAEVDRLTRLLPGQPIPMRLACEGCGELHLDEGAFATKPHHTHACQHCGLVWRPAIVPTVGVRFLPDFKNEPGSQ